MALASCASVVLGGGAATAAEPGEWTQYRQSSTNNTHVASGVAELFEGSIPTDDEARATPVIADGKMFVGSHNSGALQAFDLSSGAELWKAKAPNWIHSEMIYSGGRIFVGFGNRFFDPAGHRGTGESGVMALDAETGNVLWTFPTVGEVMPTPVVVNGAVYAVTGDRHLFRIDPATGEELDSTDLGHIVSMSSPAEHDGKLYFGSGSPAPYTFFSYDTSTDTVAWSTVFPEFNRGLDDVPPAVDDGIVVTTGNATILP